MHTLNRTLTDSGLSAFQFAGFNWPRYYATLPRGNIARRLERYKNPVTGNYYGAPPPRGTDRGARDAYTPFYLGSDFMPGLRWQWCDDVEGARIEHTGWFADEFGDIKIRGLVFRLPHGRGFLAGWSMGESMASEMHSYIWDNERDAAHAADNMARDAADDMARDAAEREREYQDEQNDDDDDDDDA